MQSEKFLELEDRASQVGLIDKLKQEETRARVHKEIEAMKAEGKALELTTEEEDLLRSFRRFKLRMRKNGEVFTWQTFKPEGIQIVKETAEIVHPAEVGHGI